MDGEADDIAICVHQGANLQHAPPTLQVRLHQLHQNHLTPIIQHVPPRLPPLPHRHLTHLIIPKLAQNSPHVLTRKLAKCQEGVHYRMLLTTSVQCEPV